MIKNKIQFSFWFYCLCTLLYSSSVWGQNDSSKVKPYTYIDLNIGTNIPMGSFSGSGSSPASCKGLVGYTINMLGSYPIKQSNWGGLATCSYGVNELNASYYQGSLNAHYQENSFQGGNYSEANLLCGVSFSRPAQKSLVDFKFLAGALLFNTPDIQYSGFSYNYIEYTYHVKPANGIAFAYDLGIAVRHLLTKTLVFSVNFDIYSSAKKSEIATTSQYEYYHSSPQELNAPSISSLRFTFFNITIGLGLKL
jgi:hypothetical protein